MENVEHRDQDLLRLAALGGERGIGEAEDERSNESAAHAEHGAKGVFRQSPRIEAYRKNLPDLVMRAHRHPAPGDECNRSEHDRERHEIPEVGTQPGWPGDEGQAPTLLHDLSC